MIKTRHPISAPDADLIREIRTANAPQKSALIGVEARLPAPEPAAVEGVRYERGEVAGVPGWWARPDRAVPGATLLYFHGGGYVVGSAAQWLDLVARFALRGEVKAFVPDYRQAPEDPFPAAVEDAFAVYTALSATSQMMLVAGDSAGGGLALAVFGILAERREPQNRLVGLAVLSPWTDLTLSGDSYRTRAEKDPFVTRPALQHFADLYLHGANPRAPTASPLFGPVLRTAAPVRIDVGDFEVLLDDSVRYAEKLADAGLDVSLHVWEGMPHVFQRTRELEIAKISTNEIGAFLRDCLARAHA